MTTAPLSAETIKNFMYASTATVSMQLLKRGFRNSAVNGVRPLNFVNYRKSPVACSGS